jgi:hypothetical protein
MVVNDLDIGWTKRPSRPLEANPPLVVDANAVLSLSVAFQRSNSQQREKARSSGRPSHKARQHRFKSVARQEPKILKLNCRFQAIQLEPGGMFDSRERFDPLTGCEVSGPLAPVADDHAQDIAGHYVLRQAYAARMLRIAQKKAGKSIKRLPTSKSSG